MCRLGLEVGHCRVTAHLLLAAWTSPRIPTAGAHFGPFDRRARIPLDRATMPQERRTTQPACKPLASAWRRSYNPPGALPKVEPSPLTFSARLGICRELMAYKKCSPAANPSQRWT